MAKKKSLKRECGNIIFAPSSSVYVTDFASALALLFTKQDISSLIMQQWRAAEMRTCPCSLDEIQLKRGSLCIFQQYAAESGASQLEDRKLPEDRRVWSTTGCESISVLVLRRNWKPRIRICEGFQKIPVSVSSTQSKLFLQRLLQNLAV